MKVFAAGIQTETNTFSPVPTSRKMFEETYKTFRGQDPVNPNFWGAPMVEFQKLAGHYKDIYIEGLCVAAEPAGTVEKEVYEEYREEILSDLRNQLPVDMVLLNLHGAMIAQEYDDCEGDLIESVRKIVGDNVPIGVELDLHTHLTKKMTDYADLIIAFKFYPHTDVADRAQELYHLTRKIALKKLQVRSSAYDCQMINLFPTSKSPIKEFIEHIMNLERADPKIISISFIHGFIWGDVADVGAKILVYTDAVRDEDGQYAKLVAENLGKQLYQMRDQTKLDLISINDLKNILIQSNTGPVVVADFSDNPGLGGMGDATFILNMILQAGLTNIVFATIFDPEVVEQAFYTGLDNAITVLLGGKFGCLSGEPLEIKGKIRAINPELVQTFAGLSLPLGKAVALEVEGNIVIVNSIRSQVYSPDTITNMGIALQDKKAIIVKSSEHFRATFAPIASNIVRVSSPGVGNMNIAEIPYKKLSRSVWPVNRS